MQAAGLAHEVQQTVSSARGGGGNGFARLLIPPFPPSECRPYKRNEIHTYLAVLASTRSSSSILPHDGGGGTGRPMGFGRSGPSPALWLLRLRPAGLFAGFKRRLEPGVESSLRKGK